MEQAITSHERQIDLPKPVVGGLNVVEVFDHNGDRNECNCTRAEAIYFALAKTNDTQIKLKEEQN